MLNTQFHCIIYTIIINNKFCQKNLLFQFSNYSAADDKLLLNDMLCIPVGVTVFKRENDSL